MAEFVSKWLGEARTDSRSLNYDEPWIELTISEMAQIYGVTMRTLRFYEEKGFLKPRRIGNRRIYSENDQKRMAIITKGKRMGLSLDGVKEFVAVMENDKPEAERLNQVLHLCKNHSLELDEQQETLRQQMVETLRTVEQLSSYISSHMD